MKKLLTDVLVLLYSIVSREDEMEGHEDVYETAKELVPRVKSALAELKEEDEQS